MIWEKGSQSLWSYDQKVWNRKKGNHSSPGGMTTPNTMGQVEGLDQVGDVTEMKLTRLEPNRLWHEKKEELKKTASLVLGGSCVPGPVAVSGGERGWSVKEERRLEPGRRPGETS